MPSIGKKLDKDPDSYPLIFNANSLASNIHGIMHYMPPLSSFTEKAIANGKIFELYSDVSN
jgi:hypothetical protein